MIPEPEASFSIFSPPPTHAMPVPTKEKFKNEGVLATFSKGYNVLTLEDVDKGRVWRTLDMHILPFVTLLYLMSFM